MHFITVAQTTLIYRFYLCKPLLYRNRLLKKKPQTHTVTLHTEDKRDSGTASSDQKK